MQLYDRAIAEAKDSHFLWVQRPGQQAGRALYKRRGAPDRGLVAYQKTPGTPIFCRGAAACTARPGLSRACGPVAGARGRLGQPDVDMVAVMRASQAISGELVLGRLLATLMRIVIGAPGPSPDSSIFPRRTARSSLKLFRPLPRAGAAAPGRDCDFCPKQVIRYAAKAPQ